MRWNGQMMNRKEWESKRKEQDGQRKYKKEEEGASLFSTLLFPSWRVFVRECESEKMWWLTRHLIFRASGLVIFKIFSDWDIILITSKFLHLVGGIILPCGTSLCKNISEREEFKVNLPWLSVQYLPGSPRNNDVF